jgi:malate dehydrogenase (oxaloacetate-decarboxylating)(NADP+)
VIYADGEDERVLRAAQIAKEEGFAIPILIGRPSVIETRCQRYGLSIRPGRDIEVINPEDDPRYRDYVATLIERVGRKGVAPDAARTLVRTNSTVIAAVAVLRGDADAMIAGLEGRFHSKLRNIRDIIGLREGVRDLSAMTLMITSKGNFFLADTHVTHEPSAEDIADIAILAAHHVERFGIIPKIALVSHSDFGDSDAKSALKMRIALDYIRKIDPDLEVDGEMQADTALVQAIRSKRLPDSHIAGDANVLIMPNLDAANIAYQLIKVLADALPVGPILIGTAKPAHILTTSVTARGVVNMTALAVVEAQAVDAPQLKLV